MKEIVLLKNKISEDRLTLVSGLIGAEQEIITIGLSLENEDSTPFEKSIEKHYSLLEKIYLNRDYKLILEVELTDYGVDIGDGDLAKQLGERDDCPLNLEIYHVDYDKSEVTLKGSIYADLLSASSNNPIAVLSVTGVNEGFYKHLELYQILIYEAYILERRNDYKLSFFTYFSALESYVSIYLEMYRKKIYSELHYALEHLSLDEKIRIIVKEFIPGLDVTEIDVWGELMNVFKKVKDKRNNIAHAKSKINIESQDLDNIIFCLCCLVCIINEGAVSFTNVRQYYYKKNNNQVN